MSPRQNPRKGLKNKDKWVKGITVPQLCGQLVASSARFLLLFSIRCSSSDLLLPSSSF